jgi:hypothetical protein
MIENGRVKSAVNDMNGITAAYNAYIDRYRHIPGDDGDQATLQARGGSWTTLPVAGNVNGVFQAPLNNTFNSGAAETRAFWAELRAAGFLSGNVTAAAAQTAPTNAWGGYTGVTNNNGGATSAYGMTGTAICMGNVPGAAASAIDLQLDDGNAATGSVRSAPGANNLVPTNAAPGTSRYNEGQTYTVCKTI